MTRIAEGGPFVVLIEFEITPEQQFAFLHEIADRVRTHFNLYPGFVSSSFHASSDGQRVINYTQWRTEADWEQSLASPQRMEVQGEIEAIMSRHGAMPVRVLPLRVVKVITEAVT